MALIPFPPHKINARSRAFNLIKERSFFRGEITLASGKKSDFYFDLKPTMLHPEGASVLAELILPKLYDLKADYVGGLAVGAVPLLSPIAMASHFSGRWMPSFFVRKEIKDHGTQRLVEGVEPGELQGKNVVILDDVTTTGASAMIAVKASQEHGANVVTVLSLVDRNEGAAEFFERAGIKFDWIFAAADFLRGETAA